MKTEKDAAVEMLTGCVILGCAVIGFWALLAVAILGVLKAFGVLP